MKAKVIEQPGMASGKYVPTLRAVKIPPCPHCGAPNPQMLSRCSVCGTDAPGVTQIEISEDTVVIDPSRIFPLYACIAYWIANLLNKLAAKIGGES